MTTITRSMPFVFDYIRLGTDIRGTMLHLRLSGEEVAELSGVSAATVSTLASHNEPNPKLATLLAVCNALDLDVRNYFFLR